MVPAGLRAWVLPVMPGLGRGRRRGRRRHREPYNIATAFPPWASTSANGAPPTARALYAYNHLWPTSLVLSSPRARVSLPAIIQPRRSNPLARRSGPYSGVGRPDTFDCSGLVLWVYGQLGLQTPRTAQQQFDWATPIDPSQLQPGDLTFYENTYPSSELITHVGIYVGGGMVVMATTTGDYVREVAMSDPYWSDHFAGAGRPLYGVVSA